MKKIVVKFGGSNLKTREDIQKIVSTVKLYNRPLVIVVSAFYGITNYLTEGIRTVRRDDSYITEMISYLKEMKRATIEENIDNEEDKEEAYNLIRERLDQVERNLLGIHYIGDIPNFIEDRILSYGERLSSMLLALILKHKGFDAQELLPEDMGLITDGEFSNGTINFKASEGPVAKALSAEKIFVVPGFYGISEEGKVTLLGRGGSDYSAAGIARCVKAESLDIWKDVNGYMTADPKMVPAASRVDSLSYTEAAELSYFGAKILHPRTVEPLEHMNIPIRIFNIDGPKDKLTPLSCIGTPKNEPDNRPKSVTYSDDFSILKVNGPGVGIKPGILAKLTETLDREQINIKSVVTSQTAINFYLESADLDRAVKSIKAIEEQAIIKVQGISDMSIVSLVGSGIAHEPRAAYRMLKALSDENIHTQIVSLGASEVAAYVVVKQEDKQRAVKAVHKEFFES
ncbi:MULTISPECIES: aspartate kinase [unclassified Oceanispirochaeta]|uniref:aspartate kinase n=1 Tax=unclassified Oceanispirochaeta TaxID=2635722 RepID=UPI000E08F093|nr:MULTISPECIES: aspartate kinase [unclassified Oceanispirochaeta]MBF9015620.1 aspartate kinase [Oceanispirochaeta sp. M2]NPD73394.1 aspartate kinase [Oceanispirochaeta sp. M1]RDG30868.1 aspartate kinase [Oceanispirochaeta sp. M1]